MKNQQITRPWTPEFNQKDPKTSMFQETLPNIKDGDNVK
jgi:hypothetical protein